MSVLRQLRIVAQAHVGIESVVARAMSKASDKTADVGAAREGRTNKEVEELREIFNLVDTDGGGTISPSELASLMHMLGLKVSKSEVDRMIAEIDTSHSGDVSFDEFVAVMSQKSVPSYSAEELRSAFRVFEHRSAPGHVNVQQLQYALGKFGGASRKEAKHMVMQLGKADDQGLIDYNQFIRVMLETTGGQ